MILERQIASVKGLISMLALVLLLNSCNETLPVSIDDTGVDYFPLELDVARIYEVEEIIFNITGFDTANYQQRETLYEAIPSANQTEYLMRVERRQDTSEPWTSTFLWSVIKTDRYLAVKQNGISTIILTFPVNRTSTWNGNALNNDFELTYYYQPVQFSRIDSIGLDKQIRVIIEDIEPNVVNQDERSEIFVQGVGLVERDYVTLAFCTANCQEFGEIEAGRKLKQTLIEIERL